VRVPVFDHQLLERPTEVELNDSCDVQKQPDQLRDADMRPCRQMDKRRYCQQQKGQCTGQIRRKRFRRPTPPLLNAS